MSVPLVDEFDVLWHGTEWVALGPIEAKIARELTAHVGEVVPRTQVEAVWGDEPVRPNTVDRQMHRLRNHVFAIGMALHTIRGHGYLLEEIASNLT
jgi:DNA-binding response OmpR family regulator